MIILPETGLWLYECACSLPHVEYALCVSALVLLVDITTLCGQSSIDCVSEERLSGRL